MPDKKFVIAIDFDGTLFIDDFPKVGHPNMMVVNKLKEFRKQPNTEIILWTCREGRFLDDAIERCRSIGIEFDAVNENSPTQKLYAYEQSRLHNDNVYAEFSKRKIFAHIYVDDRSPGSIDYFLRINVYETCKNFLDWKDK